MLKRSVILLALLTLLVLPPHRGIGSGRITDRITHHLHQRIVTRDVSSRIFCRKEFLCGSSLLPRFYNERNFRPGWIDESGLTIQAESLIQMIHAAHLEGLTPEDYHLVSIESLVRHLRTTKNWRHNDEFLIDLEILLSDAFLIYASHLLSGRVDPETIHSKWIAATRRADLIQLLHTALATQSVDSTLKSLRPSHPGYGKLRNALKYYRHIAAAGGWRPIPPGPKMAIRSKDRRVEMVRRRLVLTGDLTPGSQADPRHFDSDLKEAVRTYQKLHGLIVDGIVGPETLGCLNTPPKELVRKIILNLERWRWLPHDLGWSHINVNIADFRLDVIENDRSLMDIKVVVGSNYRRSPVFSGTMTYLVVNPYWYIPTSIVREDIYPMVRDNAHYLDEKKIRVFENWHEDAREIAPALVDWTGLETERFTYKLRQDPGPHNALGRIKFMFPNKFAVYLHDTPYRHLFEKNSRNFSAGCIRVEKPIELATYLLRGHSMWAGQTIDELIESGERQVIHLPREIPVHLLYWTTWVDSDGLIHFRDDIYERDEALYGALLERAPTHY